MRSPKLISITYVASISLLLTTSSLGGSLHAVDANAVSSGSVHSPVNQVFQFMHSGTCTAWSDGLPSKATSYLWIPETCKKVRGLLIMCANVPEHMLVGHAGIRAVCAANDLGIVWNTPSFMNFKRTEPGKKKMSEEWTTAVGFLQQQLDELAKISGYDEIATVPWLPMGESGHLLMVDALVETKPERCMAGIWIKNNHLPPKNRQVPALVVYGTAQEWSQDKSDIRHAWNAIDSTYAGILAQSKNHPNWPLSYVIDGHSGHFDCSERLAQYFAHYIDCVAKGRLSDDGSAALKTIKIEAGFVADLPVPGHENKPITQANSTIPLPWYFDETSAAEAQSIAAINWKADTQFPAYLDDQGNVLPHDFNGITKLKSVTMESDGITFTVRSTLMDRIPDGFVGAGEPFAKTPGTPAAEWLCGPLEPLGENVFRIALDRVWLGGGATYVALRQPGTESTRGVVQPAGVDLQALRNTVGKPQKITFVQPADVHVGIMSAVQSADVHVGVTSIPLEATSDARLPVSFFVVAGPAVIHGDKLEFTLIPPRAKLPIEVTVAAWQWGQRGEQAVKTADIVKQTFRILP